MIELRSLRDSGVVPRVHGNGFLQIDLNPVDRLHIWGHRAIPHQVTYTPVHDHVFGFTSRIIKGRMLNITYDFIPVESHKGWFRIFEPKIRDREDTILVDTGETCDIQVAKCELLVSGDTNYHSMDPFVFHETVPTEPSATIITKTGPTLAQGANAKPRVLVPHDREPDNKFNRYDALTPTLAWDIVHSVLRDLCDL